MAYLNMEVAVIFSDGEKVSYTMLWKALREIHHLPYNHHKTIAELCPESFIGVVPQRFSKTRQKLREAFEGLTQIIAFRLHQNSRPAFNNAPSNSY